MKFLSSRGFRLNAISAVFAALFIGIIVIINLIAGQLTDQYSLKADITETGLYEISDQTRDILARLEGDVNVTILSERELYKAQNDIVVELLERYRALSEGRLTVEYIDPNKDVARARQFEALGELQLGSIIIQAKRGVLLQSADLYVEDYVVDESSYFGVSQMAVGFQAELKLTSAINYATSEKQAGAAFITNHGESRTAAFEELLKSANFDVAQLDLSLNGAEIPESVQLLISVAPAADFSESEAELIRKFQAKGGNFLLLTVITVSQALETPVLDGYLAEWGIAAGKKLVFDEVRSTLFFGDTLTELQIIPEFEEHKMTEYAVNSGLPALTPYSTAADIIGHGEGFAVTPILASSDSAYARDVSPQASETEENIPGPFDIAVYSERIDENGVISGLMAAPMTLVHDAILTDTSKSNAKLVQGIIGYLSPIDSENILIEPRSLQSPGMTIASESRGIILIIILAVPLLFLIAAVTVWTRRRRL